MPRKFNVAKATVKVSLKRVVAVQSIRQLANNEYVNEIVIYKRDIPILRFPRERKSASPKRVS
jgi:hypothetical protein